MESFQTLLKSPRSPNGITTTRFLKSLNSADSAHVHISDLDTLALDKVAAEPNLEAPVRKRRKLRLKKMSDSGKFACKSPITPFIDDSSEAQSPVVKATHSKEEIRRRKLILENLKALELCFSTAKEIKSCILKSLSGSEADALNLQKYIANGSCSFTTALGVQNGVDGELLEAPMSSKLKRYQQCGIRWLQCLYSVANANGILADEMGLGKTAQTCVFLSWLYMKNPNASCSLIVVPTSILDSWALELEKWAPNLRGKIVKYHGSPSNRVNVACEVLDMNKRGRVPILISTIATVSTRDDVKMLRGLKEFEYLIVDEAHALKNSETIAYRRLSKCFKIKHRLLLTGTPVQNKPDELGNLLQFAMPNTFDQAKVAAAIEYIVESPVEAVEQVAGVAELAKVAAEGTETPRKVIGAENSLAKDGRGASDVLVVGSKGKVVEDDDVGGDYCDGGDATDCFRDGHVLGFRGGALDSSIGSGGALDASAMASNVSNTQTDVDALNANTTHPDTAPSSLPRVSDASYNDSDATTISAQLRILQELVAPFILRRLKDQVMHELPPKHCHVIKCKMQGIQEDLYKREMEFRIQNNLKSATGDDTSEQQFRLMCEGSAVYAFARRNEALVKSMIFRLRRICNHPLLVPGCFYNEEMLDFIINHFHLNVDGYMDVPLDKVQREVRGWSDFELYKSIQALLASGDASLERFKIPKELFLTSTKIHAFFDIVDGVYANKDKALVFSQFTMYLDLLEECLSLFKPNVRYLRLDGATLATDRKHLIDVFSNDPDITLLLVSTKAGGVGLNLTAATSVVLMDQDWNPHVDLQAIDRVHRIGQSRPVDVYRLCCKDSIEEYILQCNVRKLKLDDAFGGRSEAQNVRVVEKFKN